MPMPEFRTGKSLLERIRDWDWNLWDLWDYLLDILKFHIDRLGWIGWILVPLTVWVALILFRPTRYIASLLWIDIYRNTVSHFVGGVFRLLGAGVTNGWGLFIARLRGTGRFLANWFRS